MAPAQGWHAKLWSVPHFFSSVQFYRSWCKDVFHYCLELFRLVLRYSIQGVTFCYSCFRWWSVSKILESDQKDRKLELNMAEEVCKFNKFGYCKFRKTCFRKHQNGKCEKENCSIWNCPLRHPISCRYFNEFKMCKFGEFCKYSHKQHKTMDNPTQKKLMRWRMNSFG